MNSSLYQYRENLILNGSSIKCSLGDLTKHLKSRGKSIYFTDLNSRWCFYEQETHWILCSVSGISAGKRIRVQMRKTVLDTVYTRSQFVMFNSLWEKNSTILRSTQL
jgi:hypothetical protein